MPIDIVNSEVQAFLNQKYKPLDEKMEDFRRIGENDNVPIILRETEELLEIKKTEKNLGDRNGYRLFCLFFC